MVLSWHVWKITPSMSFCLLFKPVILNFLHMFLSNAKLILRSKDNCNPETKKKMFMWLRWIFIEFLAGQETQRSAVLPLVYTMAPFELCERERFSSPPWRPSGLGHRWLVFVLSRSCLLLLTQNFEVKCVNNMEGSKCLRLMFAGKSREGTFC